MSKTFTRIFFNSLKTILLNDKRYELSDNKNIAISVTILTLFSINHLIYVHGTKNSKMCKIVKKYKMVRNGYTEFMIIDEFGNHYNVNNSLWFWKWDAVEDWNKIEIGDYINFKYYGWRIPIFGIFPNVYQSFNR